MRVLHEISNMGDSHPPRPKQAKPDVQGLPYYHCNMTNIEQVKELMVQYITKDGSFILRNSFSKHEALTFSVMHEQTVKHFNVMRQLHGNIYHYYVQNQAFHDITELVRFYSDHDVPNQEGVKNVRLKHPILANSRMNNRPLPSPSSSSGPSDSGSSQTLPGRTVSQNSLGAFRSRRESEPSKQNGLPNPSRKISTPTNPNFGNSGGSRPQAQGASNFAFSGDNISERPPPPLPDASQVYNVSDYSRIPANLPDRSPDLINLLEAQERELDKQRCECGLTFREARLPDNWTMHISREKASFGRLFFTSPAGDTSWDLPIEISVKLSSEDQIKIIKYRDQYKKGVGQKSLSLHHSSGSSQVIVNRSNSELSNASNFSMNSQAGHVPRHPTQQNETTGSTGSNEQFTDHPLFTLGPQVNSNLS